MNTFDAVGESLHDVAHAALEENRKDELRKALWNELQKDVWINHTSDLTFEELKWFDRDVLELFAVFLSDYTAELQRRWL